MFLTLYFYIGERKFVKTSIFIYLNHTTIKRSLLEPHRPLHPEAQFPIMGNHHHRRP